MRRDTTARKGWRGTGLNPFAEPNATWAPAPAPTAGWTGDPFPPYGAGEAGATLDEIARAERPADNLKEAA